MAVSFVAAAACFAMVIFSGNMYLLENHVVSVKGIPVLYNSRTIDENAGISYASIEKQQDLRICVPLEVRVYKETIVTVSEGTLSTKEQADVESEEQVSLMHINEPTDIQWCLSKEDAECSLCTIQTNGKEYVYELVYDKETYAYVIRQLENDEKGEKE